MTPVRTLRLILPLLCCSALVAQPAKRPMTSLDQQEMRSATPPVVSPDGKWALYTISTPDWKANRRQSDLYLVSTAAGLSSTRQLTFTKDKNEGPALWTSDGGIVFASDRDAAGISSTTCAPTAVKRRRSRKAPAPERSTSRATSNG